MTTDINALKDLQRGQAPSLRDSQTQENLESIFSADSQTIQLYGYFAKIAKIEGFGDAARLFEELAESQAQYTHGHLDFLRRVGEPIARRKMGETHQNILTGIAIEELDAIKRLEEMARTAHAEGFPDIASWMESVSDAKRQRVKSLQSELKDTRESDT